MQEIVAGVRAFQRDVYPGLRDLFSKLAEGQKPEALVIACSDSRVDPSLITQSSPGVLFVLRNAGNLVPPFDEAASGEAATIEFAVVALKVPHVIVCGHSGCGAIAGLLQPGKLRNLPRVASWLRHAAVVRQSLEATGGLDGPNAMERAVEANVVAQLAHLRTHPCVAESLAAGRLTLHGWVYDIPRGEIRTYDESWQQFAPL